MGPLLAAAAAAAARPCACRGAVSHASSSVTLVTCTVRVPPSIRAASTAARRARAKPRILSAVSCASRRRPATSFQEVLEGSGTCHAHRVARRALHGIHTSNGGTSGARRIADARDCRGGVRARGKKAHRVDVLALAQSALYSGARCPLFPSPCCAPRGERVPFFGRDGGRGRRPRGRRGRRGFECHVCANRSTLPFDDKARDGLRSPPRESRNEVGSSITRARVIQRGSVAGCRVGGSDDGGAVRGDGAIDVGARVGGGEVHELERLSKHHSIIDKHAGSGGRVVVLKGCLKELKGGAVGGAARVFRLIPDAVGMGA